MAYEIKEAKDLVIKAGKRLVESGLIARTWGNISARISDTQFVITPSGLAYETLTEEQIVVVSIADCSYEGNVKPSSEKGIHADAYRLRPDVNFVIHTHQEKASAISIDGEDLNIVHNQYQDILGNVVPCAPYGISSTKKLRSAVASTLLRNPSCKAVLMKHHGTMCLGTDFAHAFKIAQTLELAADAKFLKACGTDQNDLPVIEDFGKSTKLGDSFLLEYDGTIKEYPLPAIPSNAPAVAVLHAAIYKNSDTACILHATDEDILRTSRTGRKLPPYIDDLAQIAGVNIPVIKDGKKNRKQITAVLKHNNAVLLYENGALCTGKTKSDAYAVEMILKKGCIADRYAETRNGKLYLEYLDAFLQRFVYTVKYSKQKK